MCQIIDLEEDALSFGHSNGQSKNINKYCFRGFKAGMLYGNMYV